MTGVVDYGAGNVQSVCYALDRLGACYKRCSHPLELAGFETLILPGVGHFAHLAVALDAQGWRKPILNHIESDRPFLGICLGMQILFQESEEAPGLAGLGVLPGTVKRLAGNVRVPHIGWNVARPTASESLISNPAHYYFAHSYAVFDSEFQIAECCYGTRFVAALAHGNIFGVQFHPEKSGPAGSALLERFLELAPC